MFNGSSNQTQMNPYDEAKLRNEVIFLHSLWHQGLPHHHNHPSHPQNPITHPPPQQRNFHLRPHQHHPAPPHTPSLSPLPSTTFKKKRHNNASKPDNPTWALPESHLGRPKSSPTNTWTQPKPIPPPPPEPSPQEKEKHAAMKAQNKACQALKDYLLSNRDDSDESGDFDDDDNDDDDDDWEEFEGFFVGIFLEDDELRGYYQRSYESGEFSCLVCDAIGKKNCGKKYKDCVALVQHSRSITKTAKKCVHRGFGHAVCKVLGWDVNRLPNIVMNGKPLGVEMKKSAETEGESKVNNVPNGDDRKDGSDESGDKVLSLEQGDVAVEEPAQGVDQSINKCSSKEGDHHEQVLDIEVQNGRGEAIYEEGAPKEKVEDDGKNGAHKSGDKVVSLGLGNGSVQEQAQGIDQRPEY